VNIHKKVLDILGVKEVMFAIGGSMGGMQVLEWGYFPFVKHIVPIATSGRHSAWCISWGEAQRQSIYSDPKYNDGNYDEENRPFNGLSAARMAALLTYRSRNSFESRFGRRVVANKVLNLETKKESKSQSELYHNEGHKLRMHEEGNKKAAPSNEKATEIKADSVIPASTTGKEFSVYSAQSYLRYQGDKFIHR
jgi:homoserine O-acetyltransferase